MKQAEVTPTLEVRIGTLRLPTPIVAAAGPFGFGESFIGRVDPDGLGALVTRTITPDALPLMGGSSLLVPSGRIVPLEPGNPGLEGALTRLPALREWAAGRPVVVSLAGETEGDFAAMARRIGPAGLADALEIQAMACGNGPVPACAGMTTLRGLAARIAGVVKAVRDACRLPIWVRLPSWTPGVGELAAAAEGAGAEAVVVADPPRGMRVEADTGRMTEGAVVGPAIRAVTLRLVWEASRATRLPVIATGGVDSAEAAVEYLHAGAQAVAVGSALETDPGTVSRMAKGMADHFLARGFSCVRAFHGEC